MKLDIGKFMDNLNRLYKQFCKDCGFSDVDFALIVFETPQNKCSEREPLQKWLQYYNIKVNEWINN